MLTNVGQRSAGPTCQDPRFTFELYITENLDPLLEMDDVQTQCAELYKLALRELPNFV